MKNATIVLLFVFALIVCLSCVGGCLYFQPHYHVWQQGLEGEASLKRAEMEKKVLIETSRAKSEAAELEAEAEVKRAKGMAEAIKIVGEMAQQFPEYKSQRFIEAFSTSLEGDNPPKLIFVPTEANIPILERTGE